MSTLRTDNIRTLDNTLNIPLTNIALKTDLVASTIAVTPTGGISQTNVQAALAGLDTRVTARQPLDATLTALAGVTTSANTVVYATGADVFTTTVLTPYARTLLDDADAASARATLGTTAILQGTSQPTTSGTAIDFTGIPAGIKRITVMLNGVSVNGASPFRFQLGTAASIEVTGYNNHLARMGVSTVSTASSTAGFDVATLTAAELHSGQFIFSRLSGNVWTMNGSVGCATYICQSAGGKTLTDELTRLRLTTANGTDLFDAGSINILYEG
jgi:hypothetical protein